MKNREYFDIVRRIVDGDTPLFEVIMRNFNPYLNKIGRSYGFNHEDTQDLMQETYINVFMNLSKFEKRSSLKSWITRIMLNNCYHRNSKQDRNKNTEKGVEMNLEKNYSDSILNSELGSILEKSLNEIPIDYRLVFILREKNGLSVSETAEAMEITKSNVKVRLNRAKKMLKEMIGKHYSKEDIYEFQIAFCDLMVYTVLDRINYMTNQLN